jgi:hypothetical protein
MSRQRRSRFGANSKTRVNPAKPDCIGHSLDAICTAKQIAIIDLVPLPAYIRLAGLAVDHGWIRQGNVRWTTKL